MGHYDSCYEYDEERQAELDRWEIWARVNCLSKAFEIVGIMHMLAKSQYSKGFSDGTLLREFCEEYTPEPYMPMGDTRPTADRLGWANSSKS